MNNLSRALIPALLLMAAALATPARAASCGDQVASGSLTVSCIHTKIDALRAQGVPVIDMGVDTFQVLIGYQAPAEIEVYKIKVTYTYQGETQTQVAWVERLVDGTLSTFKFFALPKGAVPTGFEVKPFTAPSVSLAPQTVPVTIDPPVEP